MTDTLPGGYFDALYARHDDPWGFETRWYERRKRAITLASLPEERYATVLEIGCSIGVLTEQLATRSDALLANDVSAAALAQATTRLADQPHVTFELADAAAPLPDGSFDLIVLSEVGYYFSPDAIGSLVEQIAQRVSDGGTVLACHWRHPVGDYPLSGDDVHLALNEGLGLERIVRHGERDFVLDVFTADGRSVAERTGLV